MSQRLHSRRPAPHLARPIDRKGSNAGRALGGLILGALGALAWVAIIYALVWIASVPA